MTSVGKNFVENEIWIHYIIFNISSTAARKLYQIIYIECSVIGHRYSWGHFKRICVVKIAIFFFFDILCGLILFFLLIWQWVILLQKQQCDVISLLHHQSFWKIEMKAKKMDILLKWFKRNANRSFCWNSQFFQSKKSVWLRLHEVWI